MVEVLVAMLLLAIGVLGFSVLQVRAVEATFEATSRSQAMLILRGLAEKIRVNSAGQGSYTAAVSGFNASTAPTAPTTCFAALCTPAQMASWDAYQSALAAFNLGIRLNMATCPGATTSLRQCEFASWGKTLPSIGTGATDCMLSTGVYNSAATCVMMEAY